MTTPDYILFLVIQWVLIVGQGVIIMVAFFNHNRKIKQIFDATTESNNLIKRYFSKNG